MIKRLTLSAGLFLLGATPAAAHTGTHAALGAQGSFLSGFWHPLMGTDHVLAMAVVGLWASMQARRAYKAVPMAFLALMAAGFLVALADVPLPYVEPMILASIVVVGLLAALAVRLPVAACMAIAGLFALFHGHAHGGEMGAADMLTYGAGFLLASAGLIAAGLGIGIVVGRERLFGLPLARAFGGLTALAGLSLFAA